MLHARRERLYVGSPPPQYSLKTILICSAQSARDHSFNDVFAIAIDTHIGHSQSFVRVRVCVREMKTNRKWEMQRKINVFFLRLRCCFFMISASSDPATERRLRSLFCSGSDSINKVDISTKCKNEINVRPRAQKIDGHMTEERGALEMGGSGHGGDGGMWWCRLCGGRSSSVWWIRAERRT